MNGSCVARVESGEIQAGLLVVERLLLGNERSRFVVTGGNIRLEQESGRTPVSPAGIPLDFVRPEGDHYEAVFRDRQDSKAESGMPVTPAGTSTPVRVQALKAEGAISVTVSGIR